VGLIESATDAILVFNLDGSLRYASAAVEGVTGLTPGEILQTRLGDLADPADASLIREAVQEVHATPGQPRLLSGRVHHRDGSWRRIDSVGRALVERGEVTGGGGFGHRGPARASSSATAAAWSARASRASFWMRRRRSEARDSSRASISPTS